jgi:hypothetical protein
MTEALFHLVWAERLFQSDHLRTTEGDPLRIERSGLLHQGDGPDFRNAAVVLDALRFEGDIELHLRCRDWYNHRHQDDPSYDNVILHVVLHEEHAAPVRRHDGTMCPTVVLYPHVRTTLPELLRSSAFRGRLACAGQIGRVPNEVVDAQFRDAERRYFDRKQDDLLGFMEAGSPRSVGWLRMVRKGAMDVLGIRFNREAMRELHDRVEQAGRVYATADEAQLHFAQLGFADLGAPRWDSSGSRPDNQPRARVAQAARIWFNMQGSEPETLTFATLTAGLRLGAERRAVLWRNLWLPAKHLWADWAGDAPAQSAALASWHARDRGNPAAVAGPFVEAGFPAEIARRSAGAAWQLRERCRARRCDQCAIMKTLIRP